MRAPDNLLVSVIVPVRNGARDLPALVASLERQTLPRERFEVIVGDDGSTDGAAAAIATGDGWIRVAPGPPLNSYAARNRAARLARAPMLAFCDGDCTPAPDWLEAGLRELEQSELAAGRIMFRVPERVTVWTLMDIDTFKDHRIQVRVANAETANLFVRREMFERVGGFDDSLPEHGDFDFVSRCVQAGARLAFAEDAVVGHPTRDEARPFLRTVWIMNRWYAAREARARRRPERLKLRYWIPFYSAVRSRRRFGYSLRLDRRRLQEHGLAPSAALELQALPIMYILMPYYQAAAQLWGWWEGRRLR